MYTNFLEDPNKDEARYDIISNNMVECFYFYEYLELASKTYNILRQYTERNGLPRITIIFSFWRAGNSMS